MNTKQLDELIRQRVDAHLKRVDPEVYIKRKIERAIKARRFYEEQVRLSDAYRESLNRIRSQSKSIAYPHHLKIIP